LTSSGHSIVAYSLPRECLPSRCLAIHLTIYKQGMQESSVLALCCLDGAANFFTRMIDGDLLRKKEKLSVSLLVLRLTTFLISEAKMNAVAILKRKCLCLLKLCLHPQVLYSYVMRWTVRSSIFLGTQNISIKLQHEEFSVLRCGAL
jgi:hypothetical protein